jgi:hypothetical protein
VVLKIKKITVKISVPKEFTFNVKDDGNIVDVLALVDKYIHEHPEESIFPLHDGYIRNYLQFLVDFKEERIYDDVGLFPYAPDKNGNLRKFNPISDDLYFNIYPDTVIDLQQDVGC